MLFKTKVGYQRTFLSVIISFSSSRLCNPLKELKKLQAKRMFCNLSSTLKKSSSRNCRHFSDAVPFEKKYYDAFVKKETSLMIGILRIRIVSSFERQR